MVGDAKTHEWSSLKEQFALLVRAESVRADDAEVLLDVEFQRRLAEVIEQNIKLPTGGKNPKFLIVHACEMLENQMKQDLVEDRITPSPKLKKRLETL